MMYRTLFAVILSVSTAGAVDSEGGGGCQERLAFVENVGLSEVFGGVAVKAERPMPWGAFVRDRYRLFKGNGDVRGGDLGNSTDAAIWLAILDEDYRRNGRLIYVEGGEVPGLTEDRWLSLGEFEAEIMPAVVHHTESFSGGDVERAVRDLVSRARALHKLSWAGLLLVPGPEATGWRSLNPGDPLWRRVGDVGDAYARKDMSAMRRAVGTLAADLKMLPGYPPRAKLALEEYLGKFRLREVGSAIYVVSALIFFLGAIFGKRGLGTAGAWTAAIGFTVMTAALLGRSIIAGHLPVAGGYEILTFFSWSVALFFIVFYLKTREIFLGLTLMPLTAIVAIVASRFPAQIEAPLAPALRSGWYAAHAALPIIGGGAFAVACAAALARFIKPEQVVGLASSRNPVREIESRAITLGYPLVAVGVLVAGAIWAERAWAAWWRWGVKDAVWLIPLALATVYLHTGRKTREGVVAATLVFLTFTAVVCALVGSAIFGVRGLTTLY